MTEIRKYLEEHREEMISFLAELVSVRSVQDEPDGFYPFGKETAKALEIMLRKCEESGFIVENVENYVGSADLNDTEPSLAILTHLDVVPEGTGWDSDPYILKRSEGRLIGRGTCDDKGPAVSSLFALKAVRELASPLKRGVRLIFGTNEENGSADLAYYRTKKELPPMVFTPDGEYPVINAEKGMIRVYFSAPCFDDLIIVSGKIINAVPEKCKGYYGSKKFSCTGKSGHASTPEKAENAVTKFLAEYAEEIKNPLLCRLAELFHHGETDGKSCGLGFSDDISGKMTCVLSMLNTENGRLHGGIDIRFPLDRKFDEISGIICKSLENAGFKIDSCEGTEPHVTDENSPFVQSLIRVYERVTGDKGHCIAIGGGTYVHDIDGGVAFGAEFPNEDGNMHGANEFITEENLLKNAEIMAEAIIEICG
ncbi:MAG: Sapep family Mn(2+)-dependent dipeptidase [Ruminococcus flavefaciens]|nr:Sapep family Mn(2+)-dependent dipeptidase [Ruminococcus flavefaciens]